MKEIKLILYFQDEAYGKRLLRYINGRKNEVMNVELVTGRDIALEEVGDENTVILTDDEFLYEEYRRKRALSVLLFCERTEIRTGKISVCQKAEAIYDDILEILGLDEVNIARRQGGLTAVIAPDYRDGAVLGALLSRFLSDSGDCLLVHMGVFPVFFSVEEPVQNSDDKTVEFGNTLQPVRKKMQAFEDGETGETGGTVCRLGDLFFKMGQSDFGKLIEENVIINDGIKRLSGVGDHRDITESGGDIGKFVEKFKKNENYTNVVFIFDSINTAMLRSLGNFDRIVVPSGEFATDRVFENILGKYIRDCYSEEDRPGRVAVSCADSIMERIVYLPVRDKTQIWQREMMDTLPDEWFNDISKKEAMEKVFTK